MIKIGDKVTYVKKIAEGIDPPWLKLGGTYHISNFVSDEKIIIKDIEGHKGCVYFKEVTQAGGQLMLPIEDSL